MTAATFAPDAVLPEGSAQDWTRLRVLTGATLGCMIGLSSAVHSVFGLFMMPLSHDFGWSRTAISGGLALLAGISILVNPLVGRLADRIGPRHVAFAGTLLFSAVMASGSLLTGPLWQWYLFYLMISIGAGTVGCSLFLQMISETHQRDFGFAVGFTAGVGTGVGGALTPVLGAFLMANYGWRVTYVGIGAGILVVGMLALTLLKGVGRPRTASFAAEATGNPGVLPLATIVRRRDFWLITFSLAFMAGIMMAVFGHVVPIFAEHGVGLAVATSAIAAASIASAITQPTIGILIDRFGLRFVPWFYCANIVAIALLAVAHGPATGVLGGIALGIGFGVQFCAIPIIVERRFGFASFGSLMGLMYAAIFLGEGTGPIALDLVYDHTGSYRWALAATLALTVFATGCSFLLPRLTRAI